MDMELVRLFVRQVLEEDKKKKILIAKIETAMERKNINWIQKQNLDPEQDA